MWFSSPKGWSGFVRRRQRKDDVRCNRAVVVRRGVMSQNCSLPVAFHEDVLRMLDTIEALRPFH
jgi:hypothetical protein